MTQRSDWDNLLAALESDPNLREALRRHLLTDELLNLPETVANLTKHVENLTEHVETIALTIAQLQTDMTSVKGDIAHLQTDMTSVKGDIAHLQTDMTSVKGDIAHLQTDMTSVKGDIAHLQTDMTSVKGDLKEVKTDMISVKVGLGEVQRVQSIQSGVFSEAAGAAYEQTAIRLAPRLFRRDLGLTDTALFSHYREGRHGELKAMAKVVSANQAVTAEELEDLLETDMVLTGKKPSGQVYVLAEVSLTVQANDVIRAGRRARILNRIVGPTDTNPQTVAVVMGKAISEDAQALLNEQLGETEMVTFLVANDDAPDA